MDKLDRESEESIELLKFALKREGINKNTYLIGVLGDEGRLIGGVYLLQAQEK